MSGAYDLFGTSYRLSVMNPRDRTSQHTTYEDMSSSPINPRRYDAYVSDLPNSLLPHVDVSMAQPDVRDRSKSPTTRVRFAEEADHVVLRRSACTDPPKIHQLFMNAVFTQDVEDAQWSTQSTTPKIETSLKVGGVDWVFKVQKRALEGVPHVGFTLVCGSKLKSALWRINASVKLVIRKKDSDKFVERNYPNNEFTFAAKTLADMVPWEEVDAVLAAGISEPKSSLTLTFELHIEIVRSYGFRRRARYEYSFFEPSVETDMILLVENKELYVNATYLAMLSPFFRSLQTAANHALYGEIQRETINDVALEDFLELLSVVYPSQKPVSVENVEVLLKLGDRYSFESVLVKCENFLITPKADEIDVFIRLEWASKYAMADLQDHCVSKLTNAAAVGAVKKSLLYGTLSHETRKLLLELMLKFSNM
ncbi:unnamed protein product [Heligmosomoides polygyrus]|uniref:BTB domain-containing protein n=1 Tax=Heligmosomoides polygyrus TaxID=6339 RepID=A0A183GAA6_HELPZ|nr:unnamed protein product [Heligmosomoides polygyrus]